MKPVDIVWYAGCCLIVYGLWLAWPPLAWAGLGMFLMAGALLKAVSKAAKAEEEKREAELEEARERGRHGAYRSLEEWQARRQA